ncbi:MAG: signal recognition particle-docking protein FtsY [Bdellovibrionaceae bacterium]|nr:signal recognition particle-docking protein FtsY [Pseudobdellovibrionaceae bacterium]
MGTQDHNLIVLLVVVTIVGLFFTGIYFLLRSMFGQRVDQDWQESKKEAAALETTDTVIERRVQDTDKTDKAAEALAKGAAQRPDPSKASLQDILEGSRRSFWSHLSFSTSKNLQIADVLEKIEEALYMGDLGPQTVAFLVEEAQSYFSKNELTEESLRAFLKSKMSEILGEKNFSNDVYEQLSDNTAQTTEGPLVLLIVGVNGAGKTTTIGKLAGNLVENGKKVLIAAGDTFRAAAETQLKVWTERAQAEIFSPEGVKDPSAVAFDAVAKAKAKGFDVCIIDTAGRLHTQSNLMDELSKVKRVITKVIPEAPHHTWLVLDANSGQNALFQARNFHEKLNVTGVILTKMDGTAKGGVALGVVNELGLPVRYVGIGESAVDLRPFNQKEFVDSLI